MMQAFSTDTYSMRLDFMALTAAAVSRRFMRLSVLCAIAGLGAELFAGVLDASSAPPASIQISLFGWLSCAVTSLIYRAAPRMADDRHAVTHLVLAASAAMTNLVAIVLHLAGIDICVVFVAASVMLHLMAMLVFTVLVYRHF